MKKALLLPTVIFLVVALTLPCFAETDNMPSQNLDPDIQEILYRQISEEEYAILFDESLYHSSMDGIDMKNVDIVPFYRKISWKKWDLPLNDLIQYCQDESANYYLIFDGSNYAVVDVSTIRGRIYVRHGIYSVYYPRWAQDIFALSNKVTIFDKECTVLDAYFMNEGLLGSMIYLITDQGNFIKYYSIEASGNSDLDGRWYTYEDFAMYSDAFFEYYSYYEEPQWGTPSLQDYIDNIYGKVEGNRPPLEEITKQEETESETIPEEPDKPKQSLKVPQIIATVAIVTVSVIIVASGIITAVIIILTKRRKRS